MSGHRLSESTVLAYRYVPGQVVDILRRMVRSPRPVRAVCDCCGALFDARFPCDVCRARAVGAGSVAARQAAVRRMRHTG